MRARLHTARPIDWLAFNQITQKMSRMNAFAKDFRKKCEQVLIMSSRDKSRDLKIRNFGLNLLMYLSRHAMTNKDTFQIDKILLM